MVFGVNERDEMALTDYSIVVACIAWDLYRSWYTKVSIGLKLIRAIKWDSGILSNAVLGIAL